MIGSLAGLLDIVRQSGPAGALVASAIVGLTVAVILVAHFKGLWTSLQGAGQTVDFQAKLLVTIEKLQASEDALRRHVEDLSRDRGLLIDEVQEFRVQLALLRNQRRRLIEMLRQVVAALPEPAVRKRLGGPR